MKYRSIDRNFRSTVTVEIYRYITYRENVALKSQVWGSLTLAQLYIWRVLIFVFSWSNLSHKIKSLQNFNPVHILGIAPIFIPLFHYLRGNSALHPTCIVGRGTVTDMHTTVHAPQTKDHALIFGSKNQRVIILSWHMLHIQPSGIC